MLARLLALIAEGGVHTTAELAGSLEVSRELVDAMLAELQRQGYLAPPPSTCASTCAGCPMQTACCRVETPSGGVATLVAHAAAGRSSR